MYFTSCSQAARRVYRAARTAGIDAQGPTGVFFVHMEARFRIVEELLTGYMR